jgi:hypothetical protein
VKHEMEWTILWFRYQADLWTERAGKEDVNLPLGHKSYAAKQIKLWKEFDRKASDRFGIHISF